MDGVMDMQMQLASVDHLLDGQGLGATGADADGVVRASSGDGILTEDDPDPDGTTANGQQQGEQDNEGAATAASGGAMATEDRTAPEAAIKFLVPNNLAGSLIGKGGATIRDIQQQSSCMVRIATSGMYFPGTMDRAVLVAGDTDAVKVACTLVLHTIHRPNKGSVSIASSLMDPEEAAKVDVTQRLLIPLSAGGLVIGRKGANIAALLKASRARVSLGQKGEVKAQERVVTVQGTLPAAAKATEMLVDKLQEEPATTRFANMSVNYRGHTHYNQAAAVAGIAPTARTFPVSDKNTVSTSADTGATDPESNPSASTPSPSNGSVVPVAASSGGGGRRQQQQYGSNSAQGPPRAHQPPNGGVQQQPPQMLGMPTPSGPVMANLGALGSLPQTPQVHGMRMPFPHPPLLYHPEIHGPTGGGAGAAAGGVVPGGVPPHQQQQMFTYEPMTNPVAMAIAACQPTTTVTVGVPDSMVGAILGRGGATINELQTVSGARITVSQRDDLMPGTENRILTISGTAVATQTAQYLVSQKIQSISTAAEKQKGRRTERSP